MQGMTTMEAAMGFFDDISNGWKEAMKARDPKKDVLAAMRTEIKNKVIASRTEGGGDISAPDDVVLDVLQKMAKQRKESIGEFDKAGRADLVDKERFELSVIEQFLPKKMSADELAGIVKATLTSNNITSPKDMGKAMKLVLDQVKGVADGKDVQAAIKQALGG
jgi:uncharacterized protein